MSARFGRLSGRLGFFALAIILCGTAQAQEGIARISEFAGDVYIQRDEEVIRPAKAGPMIRNGVLQNEDLVQTKKGTASVLFDDGSLLKLQEETLVAINPPPSPQFKTAALEEVVERRIRIVVGKMWTFVEPKSTSKTIFELPDGVAAVRGCTGNFNVSWNGSYRIQVTEGTFIPSDFRAGMRWEQNGGVDVTVDRVPGGITIHNARGSQHSIALDFFLPGLYEITAGAGGLQIVDAQGNVHTLQEGETGSFNLAGAAIQALQPGSSITVVARRGPTTPFQFAGFAPFPFSNMQNASWFLAPPGDRRGWLSQLGAWPVIVVPDDRRSAQFSDTRTRRSVFNRNLNQGMSRGAGASPSDSGSPHMPPVEKQQLRD